MIAASLLTVIFLCFSGAASKTASGPFDADVPGGRSNNTEKMSTAQDSSKQITPVLPDSSTFRLIREAYFKTAPSEDPHNVDLLEELAESTSGAIAPMEIRHGSRGRGLFLKKAVRKGEVVRDNSLYGIFKTEEHWTAFLSELPLDLQSDVCMWAYVLEWDDDHPYVVGLDLDEGSLMNHGPKTSTQVEEGAANLDAVVDEEGTSQLFALRDLEVGEELLCDYNAFHQREHNLHWYQYEDQFK